MNVENEPTEGAERIQHVDASADEESPSRDVSYLNRYQCAYCETCWSSEDAEPGEPSECPGCGREKTTTYSWSRWIHRHPS